MSYNFVKHGRNLPGRIKIAFLTLVLMSGCTSSISKQNLSQVSYRGGFDQLQRNPDKYIGNIVLLGGKIVDNDPSQTKSELTVMHMPLDLVHVPYDNQFSIGPYILSTGRYLDPEQFEPGILLTVVARMIGTEQRMVDDSSQDIPSLQIMEIVLWEPVDKSRPNFKIFIGDGMG